MKTPKAANKSSRTICFCNAVSSKTIEEAIRNGATDMGTIYDRTQAGVGPCGGSCRPNIKKLLADALVTKKPSSPNDN